MNGRKWICMICGYAYEGETPPERCPLCRASQAWGSGQETWQESDVRPEEPTDTVPAEADAVTQVESVAELLRHHMEKNTMVNHLDDETEKWKNT